MKSLRTDLLDIAYRIDGPPDGPVCLLLHGWPDDASTWDGVIAALNRAGLRTIAPSLRGFGGTRFLSSDTPRTGDAPRLAMDAVALLDGLDVGCFSVAGHDWGSSTAEALAVGWPDRVERLAMLSTPSRLGGLKTPPFFWARLQWYQWFQATERGAQAVRDDPKGFARVLWDTWSPPGWFTDAAFDRVARSFENPDWAEVTLHSYRSRWGETEPDADARWLGERIKATASLSLPTLYVQGERDGVNPPAVSEDMGAKFTGPFERVVLAGVGHFPTREAPAAVAERLVAHLAPPA